MSRLDVMQHALDEQRKDERRKDSEALHQLKWRRIALRRPHAPTKVFVPVADSDADFEMLRARVATLRLVQRRLQAEATVLTCELASVDGVGWTAGRSQPTNRSSLWRLADDLERSLAADRLAKREGAPDAAEVRTDEEAGDGRVPRGQGGEDGGWERAAALMARLDAMANALEEQGQLTRQAEARAEAAEAEAAAGGRATEQKLRARLAEVVAERDEAQLALTGARESLATRTLTLTPNPYPLTRTFNLNP